MRKNGLCNLFSHCGIYRKIVTIRRKFLYMPAQAGMVMEATSPLLVTDLLQNVRALEARPGSIDCLRQT